jgi:hypothetical protein
MAVERFFLCASVRGLCSEDGNMMERRKKKMLLFELGAPQKCPIAIGRKLESDSGKKVGKGCLVLLLAGIVRAPNAVRGTKWVE